MLPRPAIVGKTKDGEVFIEVKAETSDRPGPLWNDVDRKNHWTCVVQVRGDDATDTFTYDNQIRCLKTPKNAKAGWAGHHADGVTWDQLDLSRAKLYLQGIGVPKGECDIILGMGVRNSWTVTSIPFMPEYSNSRKWNRDAAQLSFAPEPYDTEETEDPHPTWSAILNHIGNELTPAIRNNKYCGENGIMTGGEYLLLWVSAIFQLPFEPLPYIALWGAQNTGKSILGEALSLLVTKGVVNVDRILAGGTEFNSELEGCIIGLIEERNIGNSSASMNKLKQLVTAKEISIRRMRTDAYAVPNSAHYIQTTNDLSGLPKFETGDTRITLIEVKGFEREIPKPELMDMLRTEAGRFTYTLLNTRLPPSAGRLRLPIIETELKRSTASLNQSPIDTFIQDYCILEAGAHMTFSDFYSSFRTSTTSTSVSRSDIAKSIQNMGAVKLAKKGGTQIVQGLRLKSGKDRDTSIEDLTN